MAAGTSIFTLMGEIFIDNDKANTSIQKTESLAKKMGKSLGKSIKTVGKIGLAAGAAAGAAGTAIFGMANKSAEATDRIDKMSQRLGMGRKSFQEWDYILSQNGVSMDSMNTAMKSMTTSMDSLANGGKKGQETLGKLGVTIEDLKNLKQEEIFEKAVVALQKMPEGFEKARLAQQLFGKQGQEMLPMLNQSKGSIEELKQKASDLGIVLSDETVDAGVLFTDSMDNVKRSLGAVTTNIGASLMPMAQKFLDWIMEHMPEIQSVIKVVFEKIGQFVEIAVDIFSKHLMPVFENIYKWVKRNWPDIKDVIEGVFAAIKIAWEKVLKPTLEFLWEVVKKIVKWVKENWGTISNVFETVFEAIKIVWEKILKPTLEFLWEVIKKIVKWVVDNWDTISAVFETVFEAIKIVWEKVLKPTLEFFWEIIKGIATFVSDVFSGTKNVFENVFEGIGKAVGKVTSFFEDFIDAIETAWEWLTKWNRTDAKPKNIGSNGFPDDGSEGYQGQYYYNGSHADGLNYVPFDGYIAKLHKGERVLTADENKKFKVNGNGTTIKNEFKISSLTVREEIDIKKVARELYNMQQRGLRAKGVF
jgi:hypothetical protein